MFYATEWIVEQKGIDDVEKIFDAAADLNCVLWVKSYFTEERYQIAQFIIQVPSITIFDLFAKKIRQLAFNDWHQVELDQSEVFLDKPMRISEWSGNNQSSFMNGFYQASGHNERVMKQNDNL